MRELDCRIGLNSINLNDQLLMVDSVYRNDGLYEARLDGDRTLWWRFERVGDTLIIEQRSGELAYQELGRYTQDQP